MIRPSSTTPPLPFDESMLRAPHQNGLALLNSGCYSGALRCFEHAAAQGKAWAQYLCAVAYLGGPTQFYGRWYAHWSLRDPAADAWQPDEAKALAYCEQAARQGYRKALYLCGQLYERCGGADGGPDHAQAALWYEAAARRRVNRAAFAPLTLPAAPGADEAWKARLAQVRLTPQNQDRLAAVAQKLLERGAPVQALACLEYASTVRTMGTPQIQLSCGMLYEAGIPGHLAPDPARALEWYIAAGCLTGRPPEAAYRAARLYEQGRGVPQNLPQALALYEELRRDSVLFQKLLTKEDCLRIGGSCDSGAGLPGGPDPARTLAWLELAASGKLRDSANAALPSDEELRRRCAQRYAAGDGVPADPLRAYRLCREEPFLSQLLAAAQARLDAGDAPATQTMLQALMQEIPTLPEVDRLLGDWCAAHHGPLVAPNGRPAHWVRGMLQGYRDAAAKGCPQAAGRLRQCRDALLAQGATLYSVQAAGRLCDTLDRYGGGADALAALPPEALQARYDALTAALTADADRCEALLAFWHTPCGNHLSAYYLLPPHQQQVLDALARQTGQAAAVPDRNALSAACKDLDSFFHNLLTPVSRGLIEHSRTLPDPTAACQRLENLYRQATACAEELTRRGCPRCARALLQPFDRVEQQLQPLRQAAAVLAADRWPAVTNALKPLNQSLQLVRDWVDPQTNRPPQTSLGHEQWRQAVQEGRLVRGWTLPQGVLTDEQIARVCAHLAGLCRTLLAQGGQADQRHRYVLDWAEAHDPHCAPGPDYAALRQQLAQAGAEAPAHESPTEKALRRRARRQQKG